MPDVGCSTSDSFFISVWRQEVGEGKACSAHLGAEKETLCGKGVLAKLCWVLGHEHDEGHLAKAGVWTGPQDSAFVAADLA